MTWPLARLRVVIRGGGDLGSGVAYRLHRCGLPVLITELEAPLLVRRSVSFGSAIIEGSISVDGVIGRRASTLSEAVGIQTAGDIAVMVDPAPEVLQAYAPAVVVDARMLKADPGTQPIDAPLVIGLGPGFSAPGNCDAVVETNRGHYLGRVIWQGTAQADTGMPEGVLGKTDRVLRAPRDGTLVALANIGSVIEAGHPIAQVDGQVIIAPFSGVLRGLLHDGVQVSTGLKIGDLDPRGDPVYSVTISDKALAIGGGVLEAVLSSPAVREWWRRQT